MATRADRMVRMLESGFGVGKGIAEGVRRRAGEAATKEYASAREALGGIPTEFSPQEQQTLEAGPPTALQQQQGVMETRAGQLKRVKAAKANMAQYMSPTELQEFEEGEAKAAVRNFKTNSMLLAAAIEGGSDSQEIANVANQTMGSIPNGIAGMATVGPDGQPVMTFMSEGTGTIYGTIPLNDADAVRKLSGFIDQPDKYLDYILTKEDTESQKAYREAMAQNLKDTVDLNRFKAVWKMLDDEHANANAAAANKAGAGRLGMKPSEWLSYTKEVQTQVDNMREETGMGVGPGWYRSATGIDFHIWNQGKINGAQEAASIGTQWADSLDAAVEAVGQLESGMFKEGPFMQEIANYYEGAPMSPEVKFAVQRVMREAGKLRIDDAGQFYFKAQDGTELLLPPSVFGDADPMSGIGIMMRRGQNLAGGMGMFSSISPEMRRQAEAFLSGRLAAWTGNAAPARQALPGPAAAAPPAAAPPAAEPPPPATAIPEEVGPPAPNRPFTGPPEPPPPTRPQGPTGRNLGGNEGIPAFPWSYEGTRPRGRGYR